MLSEGHRILTLDQEELRPMFPFRRTKTTEIVRLGHEDLELVVAAFERRYAELTGESTSSLEIYNRYRAGELDDPFTTAWADYYVSFLRMSGNAEFAARANGSSPWVESILQAAQPYVPAV